MLFLFFGVTVNSYNNLGNQIKSRGGDDDLIGLLSIVFISCMTVGRLAVTLAAFMNMKTHPFLSVYMTPLWMVLAIACSGAAHALSFIDGLDIMYPAFAILGVGYGISWAVFYSLLLFVFRDLQPHQVGKMIGAAQVAIGFAPLVFDTITGQLYDRHTDESHSCDGMVCYEDTYIIGCVVSGVNVLFLLKLVRDVLHDAQ